VSASQFRSICRISGGYKFEQQVDCRYPQFPNPVVAESLLDRLINSSHQVFMNGPSYRPNKRPRVKQARNK
jgi:hypothetical protein